MNILKPELVWVEGRCYRKFPIKDSKSTHRESENTYSARRKVREDEDDEENIDLPIKHEGNRFFITFPLPIPLIGFVKGKFSKTQKLIEEQTSTQLSLPECERKNQNAKLKKDDVDMTILGESKNNVVKAYRRVQSITNEARWRVGDYTHFVSIPMCNESLKDGYRKFQRDILKNCKGARGVNERLFENPDKLHLTISMLVLLTQREKEMVSEILQKKRGEILHLLDEKPFLVQLEGIEYMNDDPSDVDVLYGKVSEPDSDNRLQIISDSIAKAMALENFSRIRSDDSANVKLHVTLMKSRPDGLGNRPTFDASEILEKYSDYRFGETLLSELHVSVRFTTGKDGYYIPSCTMKLK